MLTIRFTRTGKKNEAHFRLVLQEKTRAVSSAAKELLGYYNPHKQGDIALKKERIQHWISKGAKPSATVHNLLISHGIIEGKKMRVVALTGKKKGETSEQKAVEKKETSAPKPEKVEKPEEKKEAPKS